MIISNNYICQHNSKPKNNNIINFQGLTRYFSKGFHSADELVKAAEKHLKNNRIIGSPPREWIKKIPKADRKENIKLLYSAFAKAFEKQLPDQAHIKKAKDILDNAFKVTGIVKEPNGINLKLLSTKGTFGTTYRLDIPITDKTVEHYVIKHFRSHRPSALCRRGPLIHGNYVEQNAAFFMQNDFYNIPRKISKQGKTARTNWGRGNLPKIFFSDLQNNYVVFENAVYLPKPTRRTNIENSGITQTDRNTDNWINDYRIDFGGYTQENPIISSDKTARFAYRKIKNNSQPINKFKYYLANADKMQNTQGIYAGIISTLIGISQSKFATMKLSLTQQVDLTQNVFDRIYKKIGSPEIKERLNKLLTKLKAEENWRSSMNFDDFIK